MPRGLYGHLVDSTPQSVSIGFSLAWQRKSSTGWFFGFKLHFNDRGQLLNLALTPGNVDDRKPVPALVQELFGKLFADATYPKRSANN